MDQNLQIIITKLAQSPQSFEDLSALMRSGVESIKSHTTHEFQQDRGAQARERYRQRFLESLYYPEIDRRQDTIIEAHQKTFQWVYDPGSFDTSTPRWDSMAEWLQKGDGIYWINGKAGSGKSTLMNYLCHDERTLGLLRVWSGTKKVLKPKYFFWSAGTTLEKSIEGLLRSLLYQILRELPSIIPLSCEDRSTLVPARDRHDEFEPIAIWTVRRLQNTFQNVLRQAVTTTSICIFIDGLDEITGDADAVIAEITKMPSFAVKVCLSSRPEQLYNDAFGSYAKLRLQDLTKSDIRTYVADRLEPWLCTEPEVKVSRMMSNIAYKAQGVFLWVDLIVKTLIKGLKHDDSFEQLQERLASTPTDIEAVYADMLSKIDKAHYKEAAQLFQMAIVGLTESLLDVTLVLYNHHDRISEISVSDALKLCHRTQNRIPTICGGLLDIDEDNKDSRWIGLEFYDCDYLCFPPRYTCSADMAKISTFERYVHINFIHRTAYEFLSQNKQGQSFLHECPQPQPSPYASIVRARLAKVRILGLPQIPSNMNEISEEVIKNFKEPISVWHLPVEERWDQVRERNARSFIDGLMDLLRMDEWLSGSPSLSLCHDVDCTLTSVYQRNQIVPLFEHWSMQWGLRAWEIEHPPDWALLSGACSPSEYLDAQSARMEPIKSRPIDFLGHAASRSLSCYVVEEYDRQKKSMDEHHATHLLCCSMWAFSHGHRTESLIKSLDLVAELLNRGGNPNFYVRDFSTTVWGYFMRMAPWCSDKGLEKLVTTTKTFVEKGADIHMTLAKRNVFQLEFSGRSSTGGGRKPLYNLIAGNVHSALPPSSPSSVRRRRGFAGQRGPELLQVYTYFRQRTNERFVQTKVR